MLLSLFFTLIFASSAVYAANDWSTPCLSGQCSYEVNNGTANGTLTLSGPTNAISDITPAAGWTILDCNPTAADQDIRLVCTGSQQDCDHVYQGDVVDTVVRLPENCGHMPFARVASEWVHDNQTVPGHVAVQLRRRNNSNSTVRGLTLDTNWAAASISHNRTVSFSIKGGNTPTVSDDGDTQFGRRSFLHPSATISKSSTVNADQSFTLLDQSISCPAIGDLPALDEHAKLGIEAKANGQLGYGFTASGTLFPPSVDDIAIFTALDVTMAGILSIDATAGATLDTGRQRIFSVPIAGLEFSKFFQIGPVFFVEVQGTAQMAAQMNMDVNLAYSLSGAKISFPSSSDSSVGNIGPADTDLQLSAGSSGKMDATLTAHVIPGIQFGITALTAVSANVNLDVDAFGKLDMTLAGSMPATTSQSIASSTSAASSYTSSSSISAISSGNISSSVFATTSSPKAGLSTSSILSSAGTNASSITSVGSTTNASIAATATSGADAGGSIPADVAPTVRAGGTSQSGGSDTIGGTVYTSSANIRTVTEGISATAVVTSPAISQSAPSSSTNASSIASATVSPSPTSSESVYMTATPSNSVHSNGTVRTVTTPIVRTHTVTGLETLTSLETLTTVETIKTVEPTTSLELVTLTGSDAAAPTSLIIAGRSDSPSFSGCVDVSTGVTVSMGADASFFGLFDKSKSVTLFTKSFDLFKKCFGDGPVSATPARRRIRATGYAHRHRMGRRQRHGVTKRGAELTPPDERGPSAGSLPYIPEAPGQAPTDLHTILIALSVTISRSG